MWIGTDGEGSIWCARWNGCEGVRHDPGQPRRHLSANTVYSLAIDAQGSNLGRADAAPRPRVVSSSGFDRFQTNCRREQGLSSDTIYGIVFDAGSTSASADGGVDACYEPTAGPSRLSSVARPAGEEFNYGALHSGCATAACALRPGRISISSSPSRLTRPLVRLGWF